MGVVLALETSCDETAAAIVRDGRQVLSSKLVSQTGIHRQYGGVVPEVAARYHLEDINQVIEETLAEAGLRANQLDAIACTNGPGLIGTLLVGLSAAKALSWSWGLPLITVDHLYSHVCANFLDTDLEPPFICLLVSGGHTQVMHFSDYQNWKILGQTLDDAAGEAFDKVARLLALGYPGGPAIDKTAKSGNPLAFRFPEGKVSGYDFSFSGLKTAVLRTVEKLPASPNSSESEGVSAQTADLAASFQDAVNRVLVKKTFKAMQEFGLNKVALAGGVAANSDLRRRFSEATEESAKSSSGSADGGKIKIYMPPIKYCTDNAAMVAAGAHFAGTSVKLDATAYSRQLA
jgi:putative glycoprotease GCP